MKFKKFKCFSMVLLISLMSGTQVFASETVASETANSDEISQKSYAEKNYDNIQMNSEPVDESNINKDKDKDGQLTYFKGVNGYAPKTDEVVEKDVPTGNDECTGDKITKTYTDEVDLNAKSVMDTDLDDYSNNGYLEKVKNPNNHPETDSSNTDESLYGPGNLEVQHWQDGPNESTTNQNWRILFATDYAINNAVLTVTLPYGNVTVTNATDWVINRYYPSVTNNNNLYTNHLVPLDISFDGNIATVNFGNIIRYSAFGIIFSKTFDAPQDFSNELKVTAARVTGTWKSDELTADSKYIKSSKTEPLIIWENEVCPIPIDPGTPETPGIAENSNKIASLSNKTNNSLVEKNTIKTTNSNNVGSLPKTGEKKAIIFSVIGGLILIVFGTIAILRKKYSFK